MRYAKSCSHLFMKYHASGEAITKAMITSFKKSLLINPTMPDTDAPNTFLIPISFVLFTTAKCSKSQ